MHLFLVDFCIFLFPVSPKRVMIGQNGGEGTPMNDFWKSYDITALEYGVNYQCYPLYGRIHLTELALSLIFILSAALW